MRNPYPALTVTLILLLIASTRPLPIPSSTAAMTSALRLRTFFSTTMTGPILQWAASRSHASSSLPASSAVSAPKTALRSSFSSHAPSRRDPALLFRESSLARWASVRFSGFLTGA